MRVTLEDIKSGDMLMEILGATAMSQATLDDHIAILTPERNYIFRPEAGQILVIHKGEEE